MSSKALVQSLFLHKEISRVPVIPWICSFAAKLEQISVQDMLSDPGLLSTTLLNTQELFGYDAVAVVFDPSLEAEACGCQVAWPEEPDGLPQIVSHPFSDGTNIESIDVSNLVKLGRIPVYLEAVKRINILRGKQVAVLGMVTGPLALAQHLYGENLAADLKQGRAGAQKTFAAAGSITLKLSRTYCELGVDGIVINDAVLGLLDAGLYTVVAAPLKSIWNVIRFFNARSLLLTGGCSLEKVGPILDLQADGVALGAGVDGAALETITTGRKICYGLSIPFEILNKTPAVVATNDLPLVKNRPGCFITTDGEVPYHTSVERLQEIMQMVSAK